MMKTKYYTVFYKTDNNSSWQIKRLYLSFDECEKFCKEQGYIEYDIKDLSKMFAFDLHLLTNVVNFDGKFYFPEEKIPYPNYSSLELGKFESSVVWDKDYACDEMDFDEVYKGIEQLWTTVTTKFILPDKAIEVGIAAQFFLENYPKFVEFLKENNQAVYHNEKFSPFKWLAWVKDNSIRLIHQDYRETDVKTKFDVVVNKDWFNQFSQNLINSMKHYAEAELKLYKKYVKEKYGKEI